MVRSLAKPSWGIVLAVVLFPRNFSKPHPMVLFRATFCSRIRKAMHDIRSPGRVRP